MARHAPLRNLTSNLTLLISVSLLFLATSCSVQKEMQNPTEEYKEWRTQNPEKVKHVGFEQKAAVDTNGYAGYNKLNGDIVVYEFAAPNLNSGVVETIEYLWNQKKNIAAINKVSYLCSKSQLMQLLVLSEHSLELLDNYSVANDGLYSAEYVFYDVFNIFAAEYDKVSKMSSAYSCRDNHKRFARLTGIYRWVRIFCKEDVRNQKINDAIIEIYTFEIDGKTVILLPQGISEDFKSQVLRLVKNNRRIK